MARESPESDFTEDEIEQIIGMGAPEAKIALKEVRDTISENPLLVTGLAFAFGILIGVGLGRIRKNRS